jgi:hypothetical protein
MFGDLLRERLEGRKRRERWDGAGGPLVQVLVSLSR